ncbi:MULTISPECIES: cell division protein FtsB [Burkholderiaceae]|uniref:cell division protein FtsB n=1 Tax=Burkholderiaceae TaxID=119060 RepID=UPI00095F7D1B|nr:MULTISPECIES: cell division protein FtsB [Burkholderiaceae]MCF2134095.1 cell division protein FtsB [Mycetohabitans sp. B3]MCG1018870.1 cell division protein FtsB [Mycetohabitans sp. B4]MCG1039647.1 cell division protein FtsB [Mycetohabitans sp. B7]SIT70315.1 cell division protein FtsB [Burkholderia sp. b14]SIT74476.1 cell division protein FtsB [Burkholderia sp. b13]
MRLVTVVLIGLIVLIQFPLWWGHGGWLHVHELQQQLAAQQKKNNDLKLRNERIAGEVQDLQAGTAAVEERARYEMGMIKDSEVFVQFVSPNASTVSATATPSILSTRAQVSAQPMRVVPNPEPRMKMKASRVAKDTAVRRADSAAGRHNPGY